MWPCWPTGCAPPIPIEQALLEADSVFVGTVVGLANSERTADFDVDEVWRGPDLPAKAAVQGGPKGDVFSSADRKWEANARYLVFASTTGGELTDNACSSPQIWSAELEKLRPSDARPPGNPIDGPRDGLPDSLLVVIGVVGGLGIVSFLVFRRAR